MKAADPAFNDLFNLLDNDSDKKIETLLTDYGNNAAPVELMAAVENGCRQVAVRTVHSMGACAGKDQAAYVRVYLCIYLCF